MFGEFVNIRIVDILRNPEEPNSIPESKLDELGLPEDDDSLTNRKRPRSDRTACEHRTECLTLPGVKDELQKEAIEKRLKEDKRRKAEETKQKRKLEKEAKRLEAAKKRVRKQAEKATIESFKKDQHALVEYIRIMMEQRKSDHVNEKRVICTYCSIEKERFHEAFPLATGKTCETCSKWWCSLCTTHFVNLNEHDKICKNNQ